jgi:hypothetical protein
MVQNDDARFALRTVTESAVPIKAIEHFLSMAGNHELVLDFAMFKSSFYKDDVIRVVFAEEYPAVMWHMVKV